MKIRYYVFALSLTLISTIIGCTQSDERLGADTNDSFTAEELASNSSNIMNEDKAEFLNYIDENEKFSFNLCRDNGYDTQGCMKFKRLHNQFLIDAENEKQEQSALRSAQDIREAADALK